MRVVAGVHGGRRLRPPPGAGTRPTGERVREALFAILGPLEGASVLDLFAGSGALGIEAISRGAGRATFVDSAPRAIAAVRENLRELGIDDAELVRADARAALRKARAAGRQYDLVFLDPPYRRSAGLARELDQLLPAVLTKGATVVSESDRRAPLELSLRLAGERRYGDTLIRIHDTEQ